MSWGVYPDLPKAGSYGYTVSEEDMFDYGSPMKESATDDLDLDESEIESAYDLTTVAQ